MKNKLIVMTAAMSLGWLLTGCGDSSKQAATPAATEKTPAPSAGEELKKAATDVEKEVTTEANKQAAEVAAAAQKEAAVASKAAQAQAAEAAAAAAKTESTAVTEALGSQLTSNFQSNSDSLLKNIGADLGARVTKLGASLKTNEAAKAQLTSAVQSLLGNKDAEAVSGLGKVNESKLTPEQSALAKEVYNAGAALVTQRNFSSLEGMNTDVTRLVNSVWKGNYTEALPPLQKIWTQAKLTDTQKNLLGTTFDQYAPGWRDSAGTVQKGLDTLKGLSK